jgi:hypothetical protein
MPGQFPSGGEPTPFILHVANQTQETLRYLNVSFILQANGLVGDLVHLQRQRVLGGPHNVGTFTQHGVHSGVVTADDQIDLATLALPPGGDMTIQYQLSFSRKMPSTGLTLAVQVQPKRSDKGGGSTAGPYQSTIVAAGQPIQITPNPTPTPTATTTDTPAASDPAGAAAAPTEQSSIIGDSSSGGGSLMWLAYTVGALLLLGGVGVVGTLLWLRGPHRAEIDEDGPPQRYGRPTDPPHPLGGHAAQTRVVPPVYGASVRHAAPTAEFPIPQDPFADPDQTWVDPPSGR